MFSFDFAALNYTLSQKNQYAYKMEGFDQDWNYVGNKRSATYTNLDPGTYTFVVKASNNDGVWNEEGTRIQLTITPPWWETLWFRTLLLLIILGGLFTFYKVRLRVIERQKNRLELQVKERTAEIMEKSLELQEQKDEIMQQAEELHQQAEELATQRDFLNASNQNLEKANQNLALANDQIKANELVLVRANEKLKVSQKEVEAKNKQIHSSIAAAKTIQQAILPYQEKLEVLFQDHFIIYHPKDVVSGDFYWLSKIKQKIVIVVADCTGHGVPGAFMTLIGNSLLDKIIRAYQITDPARILTRLHEEVKAVLKQKYTGNNYGMDAIVVTLEEGQNQEKRISFCGAKNSLYYFKDNYTEIQELKGDRRAIGGYQNETIPFTNHEICLDSGSVLYLGTDGYVDQNNVKRKRLGSKRFIAALKDTIHLPMHKQKEELEKMLQTHMEGTHQRDDILLFGLKL